LKELYGEIDNDPPQEGIHGLTKSHQNPPTMIVKTTGNLSCPAKPHDAIPITPVLSSRDLLLLFSFVDA
jgi:hypothetical protein